MLNIQKVVLGISGGVDSAVAALLLKQKGYLVEGVFMQNWDITDETGHCKADDDYKDAYFICKKLNIKFHHVNFVKEYWNDVFSYLIKEYQNGFTPNPDILCNRNIKFNHFYKYAMNILKADAIATGHYANTSFGSFLENYNPDERVRLLKAKDNKKDQTFFLSQIKQEPLRKTMFPLGNLTKSEVKQIAFTNDLENIAMKKESMGICFIGSRNFQNFIEEYIEDKPGDFIDLDTNVIIGKHKGIHQWTLGQRIRIPGVSQAYYAVHKNLEKNIIYVAQGNHHPSLYTNLFFTEQPHWIHSQPKELINCEIFNCSFKFQHVELWDDCSIYKTDKSLIVNLKKPKRAITPGQFAVFSIDRECLGSAKIINSGVSNFSLYYLKNWKDLYMNLKKNVDNIENKISATS